MIKKFFSIFLIIIVGQFILMCALFAYLPFMNVVSSTIIQIDNVNQDEYKKIKQDIEDFITNLDKPMKFDCEFDNEVWKSYRDKGNMMCRSVYFGDIYMDMKENIVEITYSGTSSFWIPTEGVISDQHKVMQGILLGLGYHFQQKYNKDVKVIFYHRDLPEEGKRLF
jgi:hypothetical protein